ncbi:MAG: hypothetical protein M3O82_04365 [Verrucomicrobiota bacterium]|nr:hypothetical protein [Verrucomicrobiota bacterium]
MNKLLFLTAVVGLSANAMAQQGGGFQLKNRSSFHASGITHNPFWPIGYTPPANDSAGTPPPPSDLQLKAENFQVTSILLAGADSLAVINGKEFAQGETAPVKVGSEKLSVHVVSIGDGEVTLVCQNQSLNVPLRRK